MSDRKWSSTQESWWTMVCLNQSARQLHYIPSGAGSEHYEPVDVLVWGSWFSSHKMTAAPYRDGGRRVAEDHPADGVRVSTVFLGLDHGFGDGPPLVFETMIFGGPHDDYQERYTTLSEAEAGHAAAVSLATGEVSA